MSACLTARRAPPRVSSRRQKGVALMVALVMLVIIGLASVSIMRGALSSDLVANNTRVQALASQAAQIALRYCEDQTTASPPDITILAAAPADEWSTFGNWADAAKAFTVPDGYMQSANSTFSYDTMPQCMAQLTAVGNPPLPAYKVTARGFSPDYSADADGNTKSGSVVWLQSTLALQ